MKTVKIAWFATPTEENPDFQTLQVWNDSHSEYCNERQYMEGRYKRLTEWVEVDLPLLEGEKDG